MISCINLMSAGICNLNCSFCFLQNKKFDSVKKYHNQIIQAWKDGSYIDNVEKYFLKNQESFLQVEEFCFWGGESLLNIDVITPEINRILTLFPNLSSWFVSTNFIINIDNFINFLNTIDNTACHPQNFKLQLSIDGPPNYIKDGHNGDWKIYEQNLSDLITYFNTHVFQHLKLEIFINSVLSKNIFLNEFDTAEKITNYLKFMHDFYIKYQHQIISKNIVLGFEYCFPKLDHLAELNIEERNKFLFIYQLYESIKYQFDNKNYNNIHLYHGINRILMRNINLCSTDDECGSLNTMITLLPDGTEIRCSGAYMADKEEHKEELLKLDKFNDLIIYAVETATSNNSLINNTETQEDYLWNIKNGIKNTKKVYTKMIYGICLELLKVNQISKKYEDKEQLLKEITGLMRKFTCDEENVKQTYNPFIPSADLIRRYFNGLSNLVYQNTLVEEQIKWNLI